MTRRCCYRILEIRRKQTSRTPESSTAGFRALGFRVFKARLMGPAVLEDDEHYTNRMHAESASDKLKEPAHDLQPLKTASITDAGSTCRSLYHGKSGLRPWTAGELGTACRYARLHRKKGR